MKSILFCLVLILVAIELSFAAKPKPKAKSASQQAAAPAAPPTINWGKCPQLEPKDADKTQKAAILEQCLKTNPIPKNLTETTIESHQRQIAECALKKENWFSKSGAYKFSKAEQEIKRKSLPKDIETKLVAHHKKCETESKAKFPQKAKVIELVQFYQACMDFHITESCGIKLDGPKGAAAGGAGGVAGAAAGR